MSTTAPERTALTATDAQFRRADDAIERAFRLAAAAAVAAGEDPAEAIRTLRNGFLFAVDAYAAEASEVGGK